MNAVTIITLIEEAIADEPKIEAALRAIFEKEEPTPADWDAARANVIALGSYKDEVPNSNLPPDELTPPTVDTPPPAA